jgi:hypothetical protein
MEIGEVPRLHLGIDLWFDGFDPNNQSKKNRGSVYIRTVTFAPARSFRNNIQNTYPLAIGPDQCDRNIIDRHIQSGLAKVSGKDANGQRRKFYCAAVGVEVEVSALLISKLADQPERRKTLGLLGGNSKYHGRFGTIVDLNHVSKFVRPCSVCLVKIYEGDRNFDKVRCENCTQWNMSGSHPLLRFKIPDHYPNDALSDEERSAGKLFPRTLTLPSLRQNMRKASKNLVNKTWNEEGARIFLKVAGVNEEWRDKLVVFCRFALKLNGEDVVGAKELLTEEEEEWAEKTLLEESVAPMPAAWKDDIEFLQNIDVPMHLLFLGLVRTVVELVVKYTKSARKYTDLIKVSNGHMKELETLGISWLKIIDMRNGLRGGGYQKIIWLLQGLHHGGIQF